jgi:hypothetical protein
MWGEDGARRGFPEVPMRLLPVVRVVLLVLVLRR